MAAYCAGSAIVAKARPVLAARRISFDFEPRAGVFGSHLSSDESVAVGCKKRRLASERSWYLSDSTAYAQCQQLQYKAADSLSTSDVIAFSSSSDSSICAGLSLPRTAAGDRRSGRASKCSSESASTTSVAGPLNTCSSVGAFGAWWTFCFRPFNASPPDASSNSIKAGSSSCPVLADSTRC